MGRGRRGVPEAKQLHNRFFAPTGSAPGHFLGSESARGHPSLMKPAGKLAQGMAAQPDGTRSDELPRGLVLDGVEELALGEGDGRCG